MTLDEGAAGQFLDLDTVDGRAVEFPVERTQGLEVAEAGLADTPGDAAFASLIGLLGEEQVQELLVRQAVTFSARQSRVKLFGT